MLRELWTKDKVDTLISLWRSGRTSPEIGTYMHIDSKSIKRKIISLRKRNGKKQIPLKYLRDDIKFDYNLKLLPLNIIGTIIWCTEGTRRCSYLEISNTDSHIIILFLRFLRTLPINEKKIKGIIFLHRGYNRKKAINYWRHITKIKCIRIQLKSQSNKKFKEKRYPNGIFNLRYYSKNLYDIMSYGEKKIIEEIFPSKVIGVMKNEEQFS